MSQLYLSLPSPTWLPLPAPLFVSTHCLNPSCYLTGIAGYRNPLLTVIYHLSLCLSRRTGEVRCLSRRARGGGQAGLGQVTWAAGPIVTICSAGKLLLLSPIFAGLSSVPPQRASCSPTWSHPTPSHQCHPPQFHHWPLSLNRASFGQFYGQVLTRAGLQVLWLALLSSQASRPAF